MKLMNDAVDKVRREEQSRNVLLKKTRYLWLKNPENLTIKQNETFGSLKDLRLKTLRAYNIKLDLRDFWNQDTHSAEGYLKRWYFWATHSRLNAVIDCAKTIKQHWNGINIILKLKSTMGSWKEPIVSFKQQRIAQEDSGQQRILLLLFILGWENSNSTYPHETAKSQLLSGVSTDFNHLLERGSIECCLELRRPKSRFISIYSVNISIQYIIFK